MEGDHIPRAPGAEPDADTSGLGPHQFPQPVSARQFPQTASAPQLSQLPLAPRFAQFPPSGAPPQFQQQFSAPQFSQQSLFSPSADGFGPAASQGQVDQFGQGEAAAQPAPLQYSQGRGAPQFQPQQQFRQGEAAAQPAPLQYTPGRGASQFQPQQQFSNFPPQFGQLSNAPRFSPPQQQTFSPQLPAGAQVPGAQQFTSPGSSFSGQFTQQQLSQFEQQGPVTFPAADSHRFSGAPAPGAPEPPAGQLSVSQDPTGAYRYQFALGQ